MIGKEHVFTMLFLMTQEVDENDDDEEEGAEGLSGIHSEVLSGTSSTTAEVGAEKLLSPHDIGAHWLQRELNKFYNDPIQVNFWEIINFK
jgi:hypothetical protein